MQAIHLPIWIITRNLSTCKGRFVIDSDNIHGGMIQLGGNHYFYEDKGCNIKNEGTIIFEGKCHISNGSTLYIFKGGKLVFGDCSGISTTMIMCKKHIELGIHTKVGIGSTIMDSDFHPIVDIIGQSYMNPTMPVKIGDYNWIGAYCLVLKGTKTPDQLIVTTKSILNRKYKIKECSIFSNQHGEERVEEGYICDWYYNDINFEKRLIENCGELVEILKGYKQ